MITVASARRGDARLLDPRLRGADRREIAAAVGGAPAVLLEHGLRASDPCYALHDESGPIALFGVVPDSDVARQGRIWLLGSARLVRHARVILRQAPAWLDGLHWRYDILWNLVDARNQVHMRWLQRCDFQCLRRIDAYGVEQRPFYEFERQRRQVWP